MRRMNIAAKNKAILFLILVTISIFPMIFTSCTTPADNNNSQPGQANANTLLPTTEGIDGQLVYISKCSPCHGVDRQGGLGFALTNDISIAFLSELLPVHRTGVDLDPRLNNALINWLYTNSTPSTRQPLSDARHIFLRYCSSCHGDSRQGGDGGPSIMLEELANVDAEFLSTFLIGHFSGMNLSESQRSFLGSWLTIPFQPPLDLNTPEGVENYYCGTCHPGDGPALHLGSMGGSVSSAISFINGHFSGIPTDELNLLAEWLANVQQTTD